MWKMADLFYSVQQQHSLVLLFNFCNWCMWNARLCWGFRMWTRVRDSFWSRAELTLLLTQLSSFVPVCSEQPFGTESHIAVMSQITGLMCLRTDLLCLQNEVLLANFSSRHQLNCILNKWAALLANF